jgi:hypothetical protein
MVNPMVISIPGLDALLFFHARTEEVGVDMDLF